jgi:hypothetical protein
VSTPQKPTDFICSIDVAAGASLQPNQPENHFSIEAIAGPLRELVQLNREILRISREHFELAKRAEDRFIHQQKQQREEFERWLHENSELAGQCGSAQEAIRTVLGQAITELVQYVQDHQEELIDSEYVRSDLVDRYGSLLNHVSGMYGMLKRLAAAEQAISEHPPEITY